MAAKSLAFANMQRALFRYVQSIPARQVVEIGVLAQSLNIPPRHAAYILARLAADEMEAMPWHRVIPAGGQFAKASHSRERTGMQIRLLQAEGLHTDAAGRIGGWEARRWTPPQTHLSTVWADEE